MELVLLTPTDALPSPRAIPLRDSRFPSFEEADLAETRHQIALVRALADELERCMMRKGAVHAIRAQLVNELAKHGHR